MKCLQALSTSVALASLLTSAIAHPGEVHPVLSPREIGERQLAANKRHINTAKCSARIARQMAVRKAKRSSMLSLAKRQASSVTASTTASSTSSSTSTSTSSAATTTSTPYYSSLQNTTCVTAPEVTEGPYYIRNEIIRSNITENQGGIPLLLDIGLMNTDTCEPLADVYIDVWHCNATGYYSGYDTSNGGGSTGGSAPGGSSMSMASMSSLVSMSSMAQPSGSAGAMPTGGGAPSGGDGMSTSSGLTDTQSYCRGVQKSDTAGIAEFDTVYPGYYSGRTTHIHVMVHENATTFDNGTLYSASGVVRHIGQIFFDDAFTDQVLQISPYNTITATRTLNTADSIQQQESSDGYTGIAETALIGDTLADGVVAYITIGVSSTRTNNITNTNALSISPGANEAVVAGTSSTSSASVSIVTADISAAQRLIGPWSGLRRLVFGL